MGKLNKVDLAVSILKTSKSRADGYAALDGLTINDLRSVMDKLDLVSCRGCKQDLVDYIINFTIGSRLKSDVFQP